MDIEHFQKSDLQDSFFFNFFNGKIKILFIILCKKIITTLIFNITKY
jgi:hypothetical protein